MPNLTAKGNRIIIMKMAQADSQSSICIPPIYTLPFTDCLVSSLFASSLVVETPVENFTAGSKQLKMECVWSKIHKKKNYYNINRCKVARNVHSHENKCSHTSDAVNNHKFIRPPVQQIALSKHLSSSTTAAV